MSTGWVKELATVMREVGAYRAERKTTSKDGESEEIMLCLFEPSDEEKPSEYPEPERLREISPALQIVEKEEDELARKRAAYFDLFNTNLPDDELARLPDLPQSS